MKTRVLGSCAFIGLSMGCWQEAPDHCAAQQGDATCGEGKFCSKCEPYNDGCVSVKPGDACHVPAIGSDGATGTTGTTAGEASEGSTADDTSALDTGSTSSESTGDVGCVDDTDCTDQATPFCVPSGECVSCDALPDSNAACVGLGAQTPFCSGGVCVACDRVPGMCVGQTPVCTNDQGCRACGEHFECPDSACHLDGSDVGACFAVAEVVPVADATGLAAAVSGIEANDRAVFVLEPGFYPTTVDIGDSAEVAILGSSDSPSVLTGDGARVVEVFGDAIVYLSNVEIANTNVAGDGLECSGQSTWVDDSLLENSRIGLVVTGGCFTQARRTTIMMNTARGIEGSGGELSLRNSAVGLNGNGFTPDVGGLSLTNINVDIVYSSIVANQSTAPGEASLSCTGGELGEIRNSIIVSSGDGIGDCSGITFANNAVDDPGLGGSNVEVGATVGSWFTSLGTGDFHLTPAGMMVFGDIAQWQAGDPLADIDGDPVPSGVPSTPGYDQP